MDPNTDLIAEQARKYSGSIGHGLPSEQLAQLNEYSHDVTRTDYFKRLMAVPFWFERFDKEGLTRKLGDLADMWAEVGASQPPLTVTR